jgi:hypothetical protein
MGDALETLIFDSEGRSLEVTLGELLAEWTGQRGHSFRVHEAALLLADQNVEGQLLDMSRAWVSEGVPPGDWGMLVSGDSVQVVLEDLATDSGAGGGDFSIWARIQFLHRQWQGVRLIWSDVRSFEPARRDIPMAWTIQSPAEELTGELSAAAPFLEVLPGDGPVLPLAGFFQVSGTLNLDGATYPVRGFLRHLQR